MTGTNGQLGQTVLANKKSLANDISLIGLTKRECDITNKGMIESAFDQFKPDVVLNLAAYTNVAEAEAEKEQAYLVNDTAVAYLAKACQERSIPLIHISTDFVFNHPSEMREFTEKDEPNPINIYGKSKLAGEKQIQALCDKFVILRSSWVISNTGSKNFFNTVCHLAEQKNTLHFVNDQHGAPTTVESLAEIIGKFIVAIKDGFDDWGIYHYCDQPAATWYELAKFIVDEQNKLFAKDVSVLPISTAEFNDAVARPFCSQLNCQKIKDTLGIEQADWRPIVKKYIEMNSLVLSKE